MPVFTEFNAMTPDDVCWILIYRDVELEKQIRNLDLSVGDKVILCQDEDGFDVVATLYYRHVVVLSREALVAVPDWTTINRKNDLSRKRWSACFAQKGGTRRNEISPARTDYEQRLEAERAALRGNQ